MFEALFPHLNPLYDRASRDAFLRMVTHDYWSRTWVIQEIICGKQVSILYGEHYVDWELLSSAAFLLKTKKDMSNMLLEGFDEARSAVILSAVSCIFSVRLLQRVLASGSQLPLSTILLNTGYSEASLPQDKVVALVGLSSDADHPDLQPNHELAVEQVYQKVTTHSLRQGSFALLSIAGLANRELYGSTISGLPSWVPDFSSSGLLPSLDHPFWPYRSGGPWAEANIVIENEYDAPLPNRLGVKGMVIGRIAVMSTLHVQPSRWKAFSLSDTRSTMDWSSRSANEGSINYIGEQLQPESDFHYEIWEMVPAHCPEPYLLPNGVSMPLHEALFRTVVGNMDMEHEITYPAPEELGRGYAVFQSACKALRRGDFASRVKELQANRWDWHCFHKVISRMRKTTCPFVVTDEGHMGAVVAGAKVGDLVCIFRGAKVPYILRPNKDDDQGTMQLVCPSYIHGFMDGEAIECGKYEETWIQIV